MDEKPVADQPGIAGEEYHTLGRKTLWIFVLQRIHASATILLFAVLFTAFRGNQYLQTAPGIGDISKYTLWATIGAWVLFVVLFLLTYFVSWLIYTHYKFSLGENSLKIKRGIFDKEEVAIPYRQIQDVDIERDLGFQMMGLSRLVILTAGHDDEKKSDDESEGVFPALDKDLAEWLQKELLERANIQKVVEEPRAEIPSVNDEPPTG